MSDHGWHTLPNLLDDNHLEDDDILVLEAYHDRLILLRARANSFAPWNLSKRHAGGVRSQPVRLSFAWRNRQKRGTKYDFCFSVSGINSQFGF
jgi:hypothetical protein